MASIARKVGKEKSEALFHALLGISNNKDSEE